MQLKDGHRSWMGTTKTPKDVRETLQNPTRFVRNITDVIIRLTDKRARGQQRLYTISIKLRIFLYDPNFRRNEN